MWQCACRSKVLNIRTILANAWSTSPVGHSFDEDWPVLIQGQLTACLYHIIHSEGIIAIHTHCGHAVAGPSTGWNTGKQSLHQETRAFDKVHFYIISIKVLTWLLDYWFWHFENDHSSHLPRYPLTNSISTVLFMTGGWNSVSIITAET